ncbi:GTP-binding protein [uncultured Cohaesibacter sp.]|uniref:CobW family GTP-binding protein n=1 Tax=uncultured Cohaesibacter sp. TaxID=1002546 RepID=UPI0029C8B679|nr:GTP-binding protein [uncultured Cohaesibacter sp.]
MTETDQAPEDHDDATIPVSIITGFLGAGKTTILNHILAHPHFKNSLVLVNEFGEIGIDHLLIENLTDDVVLLKSGCVCCTLRGEMAVTLLDLVAQRDAGIVPPFDHVILETTGLADPAPIMQILMTDPLLLESYRLGRVVTVVDCVNGARTMRGHQTCLHQLAMADHLVISKSDLASGEQLAQLTRELARLNPGARQTIALAGQIDPSGILGAGGIDDNALLTAQSQDRHWQALHQSACEGLSQIPETGCCDHDHAQGQGHGPHHGHSHGQHGIETHDDGQHQHMHDQHGDGVSIQTFLVSFRKPPARAVLLSALEELGKQHGEKLLRYKGLVQFEGDRGPSLIQGVQDLMHPLVALDGWPDGLTQSGLVFIVDALPAKTVFAALKSDIL